MSPPPAVRRFQLVSVSPGSVTIADPAGYALRPLSLPPALAEAARLFDGRRSLRDVQAALHERRGILVSRAALRALLERLDEAGYLDTARQRERASALDAAYLAADARPAVHAGRLYPAEPSEIRRLVALGMRQAEDSEPATGSAAVIVPHVDWFRGLAVYARGYAALRRALPDGGRVVVLGTSHAPLPAPAAVTAKPFDTPLGRVETDGAAVRTLLDRAGAWLLEAEAAHRWEHSIEGNALWLASLWPSGAVRIVPLLLWRAALFAPGAGVPRLDPRARALAAALRDLVRDAAAPTAVLAAVDLTHAGRLYGGPEAGEDAEVVTREADAALLAAALAGDAPGILARAPAEAARGVCGLAPLWLYAALGPLAGGRVLAWRAWRGQGSLVSFAAGLAALG